MSDHHHEPRILLEDDAGAPYPHFVQAAAHAAEWMEGVRQLGNDLADLLVEGIDSYSTDWPDRARSAVDRWHARSGW